MLSGGSRSKTRRLIASARSREPPAVARSLPQPSIVAPVRPQRAAQSTFQTSFARPPNGADAAAEAAARGPLDQVRPAVVGDVAPSQSRGWRGADPAAVLADHADRQPAGGMVDGGDRAVDVEDHVGVVERLGDVRIHGARRVLLAHPVQLRMDAEVGERLQEERREVARVVRVRAAVRRRHVRERHAHVLLHRVGSQQRLRVHRVEVLDAVAELDLVAVLGDGATDRIVEHDAAQAAHVDRARRRLGVVDDLPAADLAAISSAQ